MAADLFRQPFLFVLGRDKCRIKLQNSGDEQANDPFFTSIELKAGGNYHQESGHHIETM